MDLTEKKYTSKKFLSVFAIATIAILFLIGLTTYIVDPFFQFRVKPNNKYILNPRLVNGGLAKNYDYNTIVVGSSMVQNYDMSVLRNNNPTIKPIKLSTGGMNINELEYIHSIVDKEKVTNIVINIDMPPFNSPTGRMSYPKHLFEDGILNKLEYLFGYESFIQYTPVDIGMMAYFSTKKEDDIPISFKKKTNIDVIGDDSFLMQYGAEHVKTLYLNGVRVSYQNKENMKARMEQRLDSMLSRINIDAHKEIQYTFIFPCYSALYWHHIRIDGYYSEFIDFIRYFQKSVEKYDNARIVSFMDRDEIIDLNFYRDITHFGPVLSDTILNNLFLSKPLLTKDNIDYRLQKADSLINFFSENNSDWLPK